MFKLKMNIKDIHSWDIIKYKTSDSMNDFQQFGKLKIAHLIVKKIEQNKHGNFFTCNVIERGLKKENKFRKMVHDDGIVIVSCPGDNFDKVIEKIECKHDDFRYNIEDILSYKTGDIINIDCSDKIRTLLVVSINKKITSLIDIFGDSREMHTLYSEDGKEYKFSNPFNFAEIYRINKVAHINIKHCGSFFSLGRLIGFHIVDELGGSTFIKSL